MMLVPHRRGAMPNERWGSTSGCSPTRTLAAVLTVTFVLGSGCTDMGTLAPTDIEGSIEDLARETGRYYEQIAKCKAIRQEYCSYTDQCYDAASERCRREDTGSDSDRAAASGDNSWDQPGGGQGEASEGWDVAGPESDNGSLDDEESPTGHDTGDLGGEGPIDAAFYFPGNNRAYIFRGSQYIRWDVGTGRIDPGFPQPVEFGGWATDGIDAAFYFPGNRRAYIFRGDEYIRWNVAAERTDPGYPRRIDFDGWGTGGIDAAHFFPGNNRAYIFKGDEYIRWDVAAGRMDAGYPRKINYRGWGQSW